MTEREKILARIREALRQPAPQPGAHSHEHTHPIHPPSQSEARAWLPATGESADELAAAFAIQSSELKTQFQLCENKEAAHAALAEIARKEAWQQIASHTGTLTDPACAHLALPVLKTDSSYDVNALERCPVGISECDALIAQTGTVLITSHSAGGRALSVLPPHHIVLARRTQIIRDLPAAFSLIREKYAARYPSFISLITGPSRTGDIERILVLGAHGPKQLTILCH